jgi:hypothetical protein
MIIGCLCLNFCLKFTYPFHSRLNFFALSKSKRTQFYVKKIKKHINLVLELIFFITLHFGIYDI